MNQEVTNYLLAYENMKIIQRKDMFNFSLDTVLLANFCSINKNVEKIIDFGTNNAAIPLLLSTRTKTNIVGVEIQEEAVDLARKNVALNNLENQITIVNQDIKEYVKNNRRVKLVVCNPPFFKLGEKSHLNDNEYLQIARHEIAITLEEIIASASFILDHGGKFAMVYRPDRLIETINLLQKYDLEPKRLRFVYPKQGREANTFLIEAIKKGKIGLRIEAPLYSHNEDGSYSDEVMKYFGVDKDV
ncbi:putative methyltransferase [Kandleria vitulina DSM 20405]|jgi:tRNA1(Val) A37 N6-methylase TrmN6|uniref:Putative methyltransferase n=1 Tax=Kandleria vitulina DSM 20405 TaxID=1410657 RepID=A0A0R2GZJ1_9FIRM|nr:tRNA1(Val) (adenine(37)-N6)-methyltransferase [Kandleria vitulina]KRN45678.1 putative methyltransferase [Kandleria vitulina DSM 20405]MEE0988742.1 tRNA1(Val) (adenine(37)-N6)-methyltransferase [Kandleria vitulina]SEI56328.1 tRNA1(Val) A37 N6-methylase TrmN6 [Kandleria vitulina]HAH75374.1 tRNA1(Val) (adenine(37)-N6)-methyltransferase [Kandleria vitulina]